MHHHHRQNRHDLFSHTDSEDGTAFDGCGVEGTTAYYYPNEDTTQYLYETFPQVR